jgi:hypothetical protein
MENPAHSFNPDSDNIRQKSNPPNRALRFLSWFCREDYIEEIEGDLVELFECQQEGSLVSRKSQTKKSVN